MIPPRFEGHISECGNDQIELKLKGHHGPAISLTTQKMTTWNPIKAIKWLFIGRPIPQGHIKIMVNKRSVVVKVEALARSLKITPAELHSQNKIDDAVEQLKKAEESLTSLYDEACKKVDGFVLSDDFVTATNKGACLVTQNDINTMKLIIRSALIVQTEHPTETGQAKEQVITVTDTIQIFVRSEGNKLLITGLFGDVLGEGGFGTAIKTVDLLNKGFSREEVAVIKVAHPERGYRDIINEGKISNRLYEGRQEPILGLAKPIKGISQGRNMPFTFFGKTTLISKETHYHLGPEYVGGSLHDAIYEENGHLLPKPEDRLWVAYQIANGVSYMHSTNITHGDIKTENVFLNENMEAFVADFGGSLDHESESILTDKYAYSLDQVLESDRNEARKARVDEKNKEKYKAIREKMDVFAACEIICEVLTGSRPYKGMPYNADFKYEPEELLTKLKSAPLNLSDEAVTVIVGGLVESYGDRPSMEDVRAILEAELQLKAPEHFRKIST